MTNFYAGIRAGRMVLTEAFAASLTRSGFPPPAAVEIAPDRGYARDSAPDQDADLNSAYEKMLNGELPDDDFEKRARATRKNAENLRQTFTRRTPEEESAELDRFRQSRGWDSQTTARDHFLLEEAYGTRLREAQPLAKPRDTKGGL